MITEITYQGVAGMWVVPSAELAYKDVLVVLREGTEHDLVTQAWLDANQGGVIIGRQVYHDLVSGFLQFDTNIPFVNAVDPSAPVGGRPEIVHVIYQ